jgi:hypothetical protein
MPSRSVRFTLRDMETCTDARARRARRAFELVASQRIGYITDPRCTETDCVQREAPLAVLAARSPPALSPCG